jgi:hypothetical protein
MADENFFSRWSRRKVESAQGKALPAEPAEKQAEKQGEKQRPATVRPSAPVEPPATEQPNADQARPKLTMEDVAALTPDSDYSAFVARGVDENVKRSALKKLFSDPHFNVMDGLDTYIEDYNKFEPIPAAMLASLNHAKALLDPLSQLERPVMPIADRTEQSTEPHAEGDGQETGTAELPAESTPGADPAPIPEAENAEPADDFGPPDHVAPEASLDPDKPSEARS